VAEPDDPPLAGHHPVQLVDVEQYDFSAGQPCDLAAQLLTKRRCRRRFVFTRRFEATLVKRISYTVADSD
jgi:hypothetical protein